MRMKVNIARYLPHNSNSDSANAVGPRRSKARRHGETGLIPNNFLKHDSSYKQKLPVRYMNEITFIAFFVKLHFRHKIIHDAT
jgi:hypothetical protein